MFSDVFVYLFTFIIFIIKLHIIQTSNAYRLSLAKASALVALVVPGIAQSPGSLFSPATAALCAFREHRISGNTPMADCHRYNPDRVRHHSVPYQLFLNWYIYTLL